MVITGLIGGCADDVPPTTVNEFMENPRLLDSTMVRCSENRTELKYAPECVNARDAVHRLEAAEDRKRRQDLERLSEEKRQALRRARAAEALALEKAMEAERLREEAEYLSQFVDPENLPERPVANEQSPAPPPVADSPPESSARFSSAALVTPMEDAGIAADEQSLDSAPTSLEAIREELRRRQSGAEEPR